VFFGELLLRLSTGGPTRFVQARSFEARYTGAEANAAVSLVNFGGTAAVVSAVPAHEIGQACVQFLQQFGVETRAVLRRGDRLGTYYLEPAAPPRAARVIYDRAGSAFAGLRPGDLDWDAILSGARWLHWSGTAPAVGPGLPAVVAEAAAAARRHGVTVSCDLNHRARLWSATEARRVMTPLMAGVDVLFANEEQAGTVLGVTEEAAGKEAGGLGRERVERCTRLAARLRTQFGFRAVALTLRDGGGLEQGRWQCLLSTAEGTHVSREYGVGDVDRIGAGDAFAGALIHQLLAGRPGAEAIEFAAAAGCLKHSVEGDFNLVSADEVQALVRGDTGQRVLR
jgi:2-dehydro-3-deoxygluconokinase